MQRKRAVEREAVERARAVRRLRRRACRDPVLALIEKRSRFLSRAWRNHEAQSVLQYLQLVRRFAVDRRGDQRQTLELAHARVVALDHCARLKLVDQYFCEQ